MEKKCRICKEVKQISLFYLHHGMMDGHLGKCKECTKLEVKKRRDTNIEKHREIDNYRYRFNPKRLFNQKYSTLKRRCEIGGKDKKMRVTGMDYMTKEEFLSWCFEKYNYAKFVKIYNEWVQKDFKVSFSPSVDRIDNSKSYIVGNIQWLTHSENIIKYLREADRTKCKKEHKKIGENAFIRSDGYIECRICRRERLKVYNKQNYIKRKNKI